MSAVAAWQALLGCCASLFTQPGWALFVDLVAGWVLTPGRRTVTRMLAVADPAGRRAHDAYHRFLRSGAWSMTALWHAIAVRAVAALCPTGVIHLDLDDTLFHKSGRSIDGAGIFRDAIRSTIAKVVYARGLNLVVLTLRVVPPWGGEPLGLPVGMRLHRKDGPTLLQHAAAMVSEFASWLPERHFALSCDGAYASLLGADLPRTTVTSRLRRDAALFELAPPRTGKRGRPRTKGERLPTPPKLAQAATDWRSVEVDMRGRAVTRLVSSRLVLWYRVCKSKPVRLVIVRDPDGHEPDDFFVTTDLDAAPEQTASRYAGRWSIEDTFRNTKQYLGGEDPQCWSGQGPERAAALSLWLSTAIWLWYIPTHGTSPTWPVRPWYKHKRTPSFADALAALRRTLWRDRISVMSGTPQESTKITDTLLDTLARAA